MTVVNLDSDSSCAETGTASGEEVQSLFDPISSEDFFQLCLHCLFLAEQDIGKPVKPYGSFSDELRNYIKTTFDEVFQSASEENLLLALRKFPRAVVQLVVTVVQAEGLVAKDVSGMSDPYCVLYIDPSKKFSTMVQSRTVTPKWNESFRLHLEDFRRSVFTIEIWDKDPRTVCGACREIYDIHSCASFCVFLREVAEVTCSRRVDDFMGLFRKAVGEVPCTGVEQWYPLHDIHGQGALGKVYIKFDFYCVPPSENSTWTVLKHHYYLTLIFLLHNASVLQPGRAITWKHWEQCVSEEGLTLLYRHAMHHALTEIQQCFSRITALTNVLRANQVRINYTVLYLQLDRMRALSKRSNDQLVKNCFESVVKTISQFSLRHFLHLHERFRFAHKYERIDLLGLLSCCVSLEALSTIEVTDPACDEIRKEARRWYRSFLVQHDLRSEDFAVFALALQGVLNTIIGYHEEADRIFKTSWNETYSNIVCKELDSFVCSSSKSPVIAFCTRLKNRSDNDDVLSENVDNSLKVFFALQNFFNAISKSLAPARERLELDTLQDWFGFQVVVLWLQHAEAPVYGWISQLVLKDDMSPIARDMKQGSAVRDTIDIFHGRYVLLWEKLRWRNFECVYTFASAIGKGAIHFAKAMHDRITAEEYFDVEGGFEVSPRLCVALSSLTFMLTYVQDNFTNIEGVVEGDPELSSKLSQLAFPLENALDEILNIVTLVCKEATKKMEPEFRHRVAAVADARSQPPQERALYELVRYADACIGILNENLEQVAFRKILRLLWKIAVSAVKDEALSVQNNYVYRVTTASLAFVGLHKALYQMKDVFHADGNGLPLGDIGTKAYLELEKELGTLVTSLES